MSLFERELCRRSFYAFVRRAWPHVVTWARFSDNWHIPFICNLWERFIRGEEPRFGLAVPPGSGKSLICGVFLPAWRWIDVPEEFFQYVSYDAKLMTSEKSGSAALIRLVTSPWYERNFGRRLAPGVHKLQEFYTIAGGGRHSTSVFGGATGRHAGVQIFDDPVKPSDTIALTSQAFDVVWEVMDSTFGSRTGLLDARSFRRAINMQRLGVGDPIDRAAEAGWTVRRIPFVADGEPGDPRELGAPLFPSWTEADVESLRSSKLAATWDTQYQQNPKTKTGSIIKAEWIERAGFWVREDDLPIGACTQSWDLKFKDENTPDHVSGQWWLAARSKFFHRAADPVFAPLGFTDTMRTMLEKRIDWPSSEALVEAKANGPAIENSLRQKLPGYVRLVEPKGSKAARLHAAAIHFQMDRVRFVDSPANRRIVKTLQDSPRVKLDDEVDSCTQYLNEQPLEESDPLKEFFG